MNNKEIKFIPWLIGAVILTTIARFWDISLLLTYDELGFVEGGNSTLIALGIFCGLIKASAWIGFIGASIYTGSLKPVAAFFIGSIVSATVLESQLEIDFSRLDNMKYTMEHGLVFIDEEKEKPEAVVEEDLTPVSE